MLGWASHVLVKGRLELCLGLQKPRVFLHHELIVYFITQVFFFFLGVLCLSLQRWNKQDTYQNHYSQVRKAVTSVCVTFVSLPCPTYRSILPGQVKYVPPAIACPFWQRDWWNILSAMTTATDGVFTSSCAETEDSGHESTPFSPTGQEKMGIILFLKQGTAFASPNYSYAAVSDRVYVATNRKE